VAKRDELWTLFHLGFSSMSSFTIASHINVHQHTPAQVFGARLAVSRAWDAGAFAAHLEQGGKPQIEVTPSGRRVKAKPDSAVAAAPVLAAALLPFETHYPLPFVLILGQ
jgi:hypothetical protein